ncbi:hypothetical protein QE152_g40355 [Popillia japonica]|uniref:Retrotransposon gag domain-containing protein n=1 Tax=Popillia japonica TaxID=7064 RepID=A0AAW1HRG0_POPJA
MSVLLTLIGMDTYVTLKNLLAPELPISKSYMDIVKVLKNHYVPKKSIIAERFRFNKFSKSYMDIVKVLKNHYVPKKSIIAERFRFNKCLQESGETVAQFIIRLKQLSKDCQYGTFLDDALRDNFVKGYCQYGTFLDDALRDNFVKGLEDERIQGKLLLEKDLKFSRACEIAQNMELTQKEAKQFNPEVKTHKMMEPRDKETANGKKSGNGKKKPKIVYLIIR